MLSRAYSLQHIVGHQDKLTLLRHRLETQTLPQFVIACGEEGLGKTNILDIIAKTLVCTGNVKPCGVCDNCIESDELLITQGKSTNDIKVFSLGKDGGKPAAEEVINYLNTNFTESGVKVIRLVEGQAMSLAAQEALDSAFEHLPENVYVLLCTTDITRLSNPFLQRAFTMYFNRLSFNECRSLVRKECSERGVTLNDAKIAEEMIIRFSEQKPRAIKQAIEALGKNRIVELPELRVIVNYTDAAKFKDLIESFNQEIADGLVVINGLKFTPQLHRDLIDYLKSVIYMKARLGSAGYSPDQLNVNVSVVTVTLFISYVAEITYFNENTLICAYILAHPQNPRFQKTSQEDYTSELGTMRRLHSDTVEGYINDMTVGNEVNSVISLIQGGEVVE